MLSKLLMPFDFDLTMMPHSSMFPGNKEFKVKLFFVREEDVENRVKWRQMIHYGLELKSQKQKKKLPFYLSAISIGSVGSYTFQCNLLCKFLGFKQAFQRHLRGEEKQCLVCALVSS